MKGTVFLLPLVFMAGCLNGGGGADIDGAADGAETPDGAAHNATLVYNYTGMPEFCASDSDPDCDFWDGDFHEFVVYDLDTVQLDVIVLPVPGMDPLGDTAAARMAVQAWKDGVNELGASWFTSNYTINVYAVGMDVPSVDAVADPEVIVVSTAAEPGAGIGLEPKQIACILLDGPVPGDRASFIPDLTERVYPVHMHDGLEIYAADCTGTGFTCFAINVGTSNPLELYDLVAHEVGHCLGVGHVGDAGDFRSRYAPIEDIMSYQTNPQQVHCVSSLNLRTLEGVYAHLLDRPTDDWLPYGSFYAMHPGNYTQVQCANP